MPKNFKDAEIHEKKQTDPSHGPLTRRFAAQESKKSTLPVSNSNGSGNTMITDDELKSLVDHPTPMSLEQSKPMYSDPDQMEEVEMEDISEVPILDIDNCDANKQDLETDQENLVKFAILFPPSPPKTFFLN
ncbi:hypothetical protein TanjilG_32837 [Lupinus angustifolius]|uniref:Uncharacterized protein n=1 Tax=Lupinus angustifolius TaxID=3871 RepID=A0A4P1RSF2_LUPAN|nr:hypothetical protein TanjilG_32837 [Lupinus angustifolius]